MKAISFDLNPKNSELLREGPEGNTRVFIDENSKLKKVLKKLELEKNSSSMENKNEEILFEAKKRIEQFRVLEGCKNIHRIEQFVIDTENDCIYLVSEFQPKNNLLSFLAQTVELPTSIILKSAFCILNGLAYSHNLGISHGNLKPENLLLDSSGSIIISDWELVPKRLNEEIRSGIASFQIYSSPEIFSKTKIFSENIFKSDSYSVGILLLLLFGCPQSELQFIDKIDEEIHDLKVKKIIRKYVTPRTPDFEELLLGLLQFSSFTRMDITQAFELLKSKFSLKQPAKATVVIQNEYKAFDIKK